MTTSLLQHRLNGYMYTRGHVVPITNVPSIAHVHIAWKHEVNLYYHKSTCVSGCHFVMFFTDNVARIRHEGASGNTEVSRELVPLLASTSATLDRIFPSEDISEVSSHITKVGPACFLK